MDMEFQTKLLHGKSVDNYANGPQCRRSVWQMRLPMSHQNSWRKYFRTRHRVLRILELQILQWMPLTKSK